MISVSYSDIPAFLHNGAFYRSLSADEPDNVIEAPGDCFTISTSIADVSDYARFLRVASFWMLDELSEECIAYMFEHPYEDWEGTAREVLEQSAQTRLLDIIQNLFYLPDEALAEAIRSGRADFVRYLVTTASTDCQATREAAKSGRLDFLQLLHAHNHPWDVTVTCTAASSGHLNCLVYLHGSGCLWNQQLYRGAIQHTDCCIYAHQQGLAWPREMAKLISSRGDVPLLVYAQQHGVTCDKQTVVNAATEGNVAVLRHLLEAGHPADADTCNGAAYNNHVDCLRVLHDHNAAWDTLTASVAAFSSHLSSLQFLHTNGCPWGTDVTKHAATNGSVETLRYAIDNGCPYDAYEVVARAAEAVNGSLACLKYLVEEKHIPMNTDGTVFVGAFVRGDVQCIEHLMQANCPHVPTTPRAQKGWREIGALVPYSPTHIAINEHGLPERREGSALDMNIARCIEHATGHGWDLKVAGAGLVEFMVVNKEKYPLSYALCCF